jgi:hypothetical protein
MGEVITVDFKRKPVKFDLDKFIYDFVEALQAGGLVDDDIEDIVEAVEDYEVYKTLDADLKEIVDGYFLDIKAL